MATEGSLLCPQESATGPNPGLDESSTQTAFLFL
jgi:hypothetical protein